VTQCVCFFLLMPTSLGVTQNNNTKADDSVRKDFCFTIGYSFQKISAVKKYPTTWMFELHGLEFLLIKNQSIVLTIMFKFKKKSCRWFGFNTIVCLNIFKKKYMKLIWNWQKMYLLLIAFLKTNTKFLSLKKAMARSKIWKSFIKNLVTVCILIVTNSIGVPNSFEALLDTLHFGTF